MDHVSQVLIPSHSSRKKQRRMLYFQSFFQWILVIFWETNITKAPYKVLKGEASLRKICKVATFLRCFKNSYLGNSGKMNLNYRWQNQCTYQTHITLTRVFSQKSVFQRHCQNKQSRYFEAHRQTEAIAYCHVCADKTLFVFLLFLFFHNKVSFCLVRLLLW